MTDRPTAIEVETPFPGAQIVVCYNDTLTNKIIPANRVEGDPTPLIIQTLSEPHAVVIGTTNPGYIAFVGSSAGSSGNGSPFVVIVDPHGLPKPAVASVGFRRDFKDLDRHQVLWRRNV